VSALDAAVILGAMVVAFLSGLYAGMGLRADDPIDRRAELWFAGVMWAVALTGAHMGGRWGVGMVNGTQVLFVGWSLLHFPQWRTLQTPVPRLFPLVTMMMALLCIAVLGIAIAVDGMP
jgi:hypothetical protein